jgi:hypothetical protein
MVRWGPVGAVLLAAGTGGAVVTAALAMAVMAVPPLGGLTPGGSIVVHVYYYGPYPYPTGCVVAETDPPNPSHLESEGVESRGVSCLEGSGGPDLVITPPVAHGTLAIEWNHNVTRLPFHVPLGTSAIVNVEPGHSGFTVRPSASLDSWSQWEDGEAWIAAAGVQGVAFLVFLVGLAAGVRARWTASFLTAAMLLWIPLGPRRSPHVGGLAILFGWALLALDGWMRTREKPLLPGKNVQAGPPSPP